MNQKKFLVLVLFVVLLALQSVSHAAEDESGFFGIKKFVKKSASANSSKKKIIDAGAGAASKTAGRQGNDSELTDEEKNMIQEMSKKTPKNKAEAAEIPANEKAKLPPSELAAIAPKTPPAAPKGPLLVPKNPNDSIIRVPQPPSKVPQNPNSQTTQGGSPTAPPGTAKKP